MTAPRWLRRLLYDPSCGGILGGCWVCRALGIPLIIGLLLVFIGLVLSVWLR